MRGGAFHDRDELHVAGAAFVAEEGVDLTAVRGVGVVHGGERVPLHAVFAQVTQTAHDPVEGGLATLVDPVGVVQFARTVHGESDQEVVVPEELGPFPVDERAVGLDGVDDPPTGRGVSPLVLH
ncbi:hypothetical protein P1P68_08040 [Streptomyces scabiei]|nr:hypothetical protein [Streptomyces scabiei]MDW8804737.1 hypothetical protein [Streptomyces scabiei]